MYKSINVNLMEVVMKIELRAYESVGYEGYICPSHGATYNDKVCPQCGKSCTYYEDEKEHSVVRIAVFTSEEVSDALHEYEKFSSRSGEYWERAIQSSRTRIRDFIFLYFGEPDEFGYTLEFDGYMGETPEITDQLDKLFKILEYTDRYNQCACSIESYDNYRLIVSSDW